MMAWRGSITVKPLILYMCLWWTAKGMSNHGWSVCMCVFGEALKGCPIMAGQSDCLLSAFGKHPAVSSGRGGTLLCVSQQRAQPGRTPNTHAHRKWVRSVALVLTDIGIRLCLSSCSSARHSNPQSPMATSHAVHLPVFWVDTYLMANHWSVKSASCLSLSVFFFI